MSSESGAIHLRPAPTSLAGEVPVVADDRVNQHVIHLLVEKPGLQAVIVVDGAAAVAMATRQPWDAIPMGCRMSGIDGLEATRQMRPRLDGRPLPIIALPTNALTGDRQDCKHAAMDDFLAKPVRQEELRAWQVRWLRPPAA